MKTLVLLAFFVSSSLFAFPVPKELIDGEITVTTKAGKIYKFSSNEYKVVKRTQKMEVMPSVVVINNILIKPAMLEEQKKNRIRLMIGSGPSDSLSIESNPTYMKFAVKRELILGASYDRIIDNNISVGGTALSNSTFLVNIGLDF